MASWWARLLRRKDGSPDGSGETRDEDDDGDGDPPARERGGESPIGRKEKSRWRRHERWRGGQPDPSPLSAQLGAQQPPSSPPPPVLTVQFHHRRVIRRRKEVRREEEGDEFKKQEEEE